MKTFIVPTDFSTAATHAAQYAGTLAKATGAAVLLVHVYQLPVTMSDLPVLVVSTDELKKNADAGLQRAAEEARAAVPGVAFEFESRMGDVLDEINDVCRSREVLALVTGTKDMTGFERFLLGNTTLSLVKKCHRPVIAVPEGTALRLPAKVALALDFVQAGETPVETINNLVGLLNAELHVVHVEEDGQELTAAGVPPGLRCTAFHSLKEADVAEGIQHFVDRHGIDLVLVLPHKHSLYERLFFKGHTADILKATPVPVMSIRATSQEPPR